MNKNDYRPFNDIYEFIKEQDNHRAPWTVKNEHGYYYLTETILDVLSEQMKTKEFWKLCFVFYYWADGTPFGIKKTSNS
jgi:hypothetical protein